MCAMARMPRQLAYALWWYIGAMRRPNQHNTHMCTMRTSLRKFILRARTSTTRPQEPHNQTTGSRRSASRSTSSTWRSGYQIAVVYVAWSTRPLDAPSAVPTVGPTMDRAEHVHDQRFVWWRKLGHHTLPTSSHCAAAGTDKQLDLNVCTI